MMINLKYDPILGLVNWDFGEKTETFCERHWKLKSITDRYEGVENEVRYNRRILNPNKKKMAKRTLNKPVRYNNCRIEASPLGKYPDMVTIIRTPKKLKVLENKKYLNLLKAKVAIDAIRADTMISSGGIKVNKTLQEMGMGSEMNF